MKSSFLSLAVAALFALSLSVGCAPQDPAEVDPAEVDIVIDTEPVEPADSNMTTNAEAPVEEVPAE